MALQVWLPLNGDLHNQGLSNAEIVTTGATINTSGKIGSCYSFDGSDDLISISCSDLYKTFSGGSQQFSVAFWVYHADSTRAIIFGDYGLTGTIGFNIELTAEHQVRFYWNGSPDKNFAAATAVVVSTWTHIVLTYDGNKLNIYKNGILQSDSWSGTLTAKNKTSGLFYLGRDSRTGTTVLNGRLNDFRIYNHALSVKEVEELAKGLVLHYKFNETYINENLMPDSLEMKLGSANPSTGTWRTAGSNNMTRSRVTITDTPDGSGYGFQNSGIQTANDGSCYGIDSFPMEPNTVYTISMWARIVNGTEGYAGFNIYSSTLIKGSHLKIDKNYYVTQLPSNGNWVKCWCVFKTNTATTRNIYIGITTGSTSVTTQMTNVHLEKGDANYNIVYDSSGYNNNGWLIGGEITTNTPRYNTAIYLQGATVDSSSNTITGAQYFYGSLPLPASSALTISWWGNNIKYGRGGIFETTAQIFDSTNGSSGTDYNTTAIANWDSTFGIYNSSTRINIFSSFVKDSTWHYHTIVFDATKVYYYCDGVLITSSALTGMLPAFNGIRMGLGRAGGVHRQIEQKVSDLRIYVTALTEKQIKELYGTSATADKNGNVYTREVIE